MTYLRSYITTAFMEQGSGLLNIVCSDAQGMSRVTFSKFPQKFSKNHHKSPKNLILHFLHVSNNSIKLAYQKDLQYLQIPRYILVIFQERISPNLNLYLVCRSKLPVSVQFISLNQTRARSDYRNPMRFSKFEKFPMNYPLVQILWNTK